MTEIAINVAQLQKLGRNLGKIRPEIAKEFNASLKEAGELVAADARIRAQFSSRIPGTIKVKRGGVNVRIVAGGEGKPHRGESKAFENKGKGGSFRHPVWGHRDRWVTQTAHPFLRPAGLENAEKAAELILHAVDRVFERI